MGLIDFVKNVGKKILGRDDDDAPAQAAPAAAGQGGPTPQQVADLHNRKKEVALEKHIQASGLAVEGLKVEVDGEKVTLRGKVKTQEDKEKLVLLSGNHADFSQVDDSHVEVTEPAPEAVYYEVVSGDTLSGIAKKHYGNANKYMVIFEANKPMLKDPDEIYPGQKLRIPPQA